MGRSLAPHRHPGTAGPARRLPRDGAEVLRAVSGRRRSPGALRRGDGARGQGGSPRRGQRGRGQRPDGAAAAARDLGAAGRRTGPPPAAFKLDLVRLEPGWPGGSAGDGCASLPARARRRPSLADCRQGWQGSALVLPPSGYASIAPAAAPPDLLTGARQRPALMPVRPVTRSPRARPRKTAAASTSRRSAAWRRSVSASRPQRSISNSSSSRLAARACPASIRPLREREAQHQRAERGGRRMHADQRPVVQRLDRRPQALDGDLGLADRQDRGGHREPGAVGARRPVEQRLPDLPPAARTRSSGAAAR